MQNTWRIASILLLAATGCATRTPRPSLPVAPTQTSSIAPVNFGVTTGKIAILNAQLKFVVVDFGGQRQPPVGATLGVFRAGQRSGTIRLTEPVRGQFVTADILDGEPKPGDEAR